MSRIVGGERLLGNREKSVMLKQLKAVSKFCGIELFSYCIMSNHYHLLVLVPEKIELTKEDMYSKLLEYYGPRSIQLKRLDRQIQINGEMSDRDFERFKGLMGDISSFQKLFKQRFTIWYNYENDRKGTLWMERFKSLLVENSDYSRLMVSNYIDLNPVRAGIVNDPADYMFSSYGEAVR